QVSKIFEHGFWRFLALATGPRNTSLCVRWAIPMRFRQAILVCCAAPVSMTSANSTNVLKVGDRGGHTWQCICGRGRRGFKARDARNDLRRDEFRDLLGAWPSHRNSG